MAQGVPHTRFNSSRLVRALAELAVADVPESKQSFAERLGQWLGFNDGLALYSALNAGTAGAPDSPSAAPAADHAALRQAFDRVRRAVADSVARDEALDPAKVKLEPPSPALQGVVDGPADFAPFHRRHLAHQRDMNAKIAPLRATVRTALSRHSPVLKRLAVLDAVLEQALAARERDLLATLPGLLGKRFEHLRAAHQARLAQTQVADDAAQWIRPGGWLAVFCGEMKTVLLAELELRLQPVAGLIAALDHEVTSKQ